MKKQTKKTTKQIVHDGEIDPSLAFWCSVSKRPTLEEIDAGINELEQIAKLGAEKRKGTK